MGDRRRSYSVAVTSFGSTAIGLGVGALPGILPAGAARASPETTQKRDLVVLQWSDLTALDPHGASYTTDCRVVSNIFDTLVRRHPDGTLRPSLATAWQPTGPTTWHLTLRPDVRWHDGTRFTAVDAKYSLDRTFDPSVKAARLLQLFQTIDRTEVPDPETLVIHTKRPDVLIPARLAAKRPGRGDPAVRGLRDAPLRRVHAEPRPAARAPALQLPAATRLRRAAGAGVMA